MSESSQWKDLRNDRDISKPLAEFLIEFCRLEDHKQAALLVRDFSWKEHFEALEEIPSYKKWYELVLQILDKAAEDEAYRRAVYGVQEEVIHRGEQTGVFKTNYSDSLLVKVIGSRTQSRYSAKPESDDTGGSGAGVVLMLPDNNRDRPRIRDLGDQPAPTTPELPETADDHEE